MNMVIERTVYICTFLKTNKDGSYHILDECLHHIFYWPVRP